MDGRFKGRVIGEVVLGESKEKATPFIQFYGEITQEGPEKGKRARFDGFFSAKTQERIIESLQICGWKGDDLSEFTDGKLHGLDTNEVEFVVSEEEYTVDVEDEETGETHPETRAVNRIQFINRVGGWLNVDNAMTPDKAKSFGERMRGIVLKTKAKKGGSDEPGSDTSFNYGANDPQNQATGTSGRKF